MLRVGYPSTLAAELFDDFPNDIELIPIPDDPDRVIEIDVWIPDFFPGRARHQWQHVRGVRLVLSLIAGVEWLPALVGPEVTICNAQGAHNIPTAEWVLTAILAVLKQFPFYLEVQHAQQWKRRFEAGAHYAAITGDARALYPPVMLEELTGKSVLLVGHGAIGQEIERMLTPFRVDLVRVARRARLNPELDPKVHAVSELDNLLPHAEIVILILPISPETHGLIGSRQIALMRQGTLLVNAARGPIVDTDALVEALQAGRIRAALDVTDPEPLPQGHPLWSCPNLLLTPHVAAASPQCTPNAVRVVAAELRRYLRGEPLRNVVQPGAFAALRS
jgi:phosphoglycerate dehydrogenase-like enzyme